MEQSEIREEITSRIRKSSVIITTPRAAGFTATCMVCRRTVVPWPLQRADVCSPKDWAVCIRQYESPKVTLALVT